MDRLAQKIAVSVAAGSATTTYEFDPIDLSNADILTFRFNLATIGTDAADTFNIYVQARRADGTWDDRAAFPQFLGTAADAEVYDMVLQKFGTLDTTEEGREPQGSAGGARLTANTVLNGGFPGVYRGNVTGPSSNPATNTAGASWRLQIVAVDANSNGFLTGTLYVFADSAV